MKENDSIREIMYGKRPLKRTNPKPGQSEWYYLDPRGASIFSDMKEINVERENLPNPYANEIKNYLYENDAYNYKQLYGDTPPMQTQDNNVQQLHMPAGSEQQITMPRPPKPTTWDKFKDWVGNTGDAMQAASVGYATGATLGNFDEAMGTATAAVTFNPDNYIMGRDAIRQLQNDLQQRHPIAYGVGEFTGAMMTPMHLAKDTTFANKALNAFTDTLNASVGYANNWNDFATNLAVNGAANWLGLKAEQLPIFRALARPLMQLGKKIFKQGINSSADKLKNMYYKNNEDDEEYYY